MVALPVVTVAAGSSPVGSSPPTPPPDGDHFSYVTSIADNLRLPEVPPIVNLTELLLPSHVLVLKLPESTDIAFEPSELPNVMTTFLIFFPLGAPIVKKFPPYTRTAVPEV